MITGLSVCPSSVVVLLSGGVDSTTVLADVLEHEPSKVAAVSFQYGQIHAVEIESAAMVADYYEVPHFIMQVPGVFSKSPLIRIANQKIPVGEDPHREGIADTYVPRRNTVLLALAAAFAEQQGLRGVAFGAHQTDSNYPDCTPDFANAVNQMLIIGSQPEERITLYAPIIYMTKAEVLLRAIELEAPIGITHSCYRGQSPACGICDTCQIRIEAFKQIGIIDPIDYAIDIDWGDAVPLE